jgi:hypothetical protein
MAFRDPSRTHQEKPMRTRTSIALLSAALLTPLAHAQDKLYGTNVDYRIAVAFKVSPEIAQKLLPAGWESNPGANGANLGISMVEGISAEDADGKPGKPYTGVAITLPAKKAGTNESGAMVAAGLFTANYAPGAYGVFGPAKITIDKVVHTDTAGKTRVQETWNLKGDKGDSVAIKVDYVRGDVKKGKTETRVYSAAKPEFFRIYRVEQGTEAVKDAKFSIKATGAKLSSIFDGKQQVVTVTAIPWYSRAVSLPSL